MGIGHQVLRLTGGNGRLHEERCGVEYPHALGLEPGMEIVMGGVMHGLAVGGVPP